MPAYEYLCQACGNHFERRQKMSEAAIDSCPQCGGQVKRLISGGAGVIAKGGESRPATRGGCEESGACCAPEMGCGGGMCGCGH